MFKVVKLVWVDALSISEWKTLQELDKDQKSDQAPCISIGFLIKTTKDFYYVANTVSGRESEEEILSNGIMLIPKKWVKSKEIIELDLDFGEDD